MSDQQAPHLTEAAVRKVVAQALELLALALAVAAVVVFVLMVVVFLTSDAANGGAPGDFPGRYWFAVLPLLAAALTLYLGADRVRGPRRSSAPADWYR